MTANHQDPQRSDSLDVDKVTLSLSNLPSPTIEVEPSYDDPNPDPSIDRRM